MFYFPQSTIYFLILSSFSSSNTFFINCVLKFKYQPGYLPFRDQRDMYVPLVMKGLKVNVSDIGWNLCCHWIKNGTQ